MIAILSLFAISGCAQASRLQGTWDLIQKNDPKSHTAFDHAAITFQNDGTGVWLNKESGKREPFQFVATDDRLTFHPGDEWEATFPYRISAGLLVLREDLVFERRK